MPRSSVDDDTLTEKGISILGDKAGTTKVLIIACGALAREILALKAMGGWDHVDLQCLPAKLHLTPEKITYAVEVAVRNYRDSYASIFVAYADCGTGGLLEAKCRELGVEMISGPHCYSFFDGNTKFAQRAEDEMTSFYLTDFLVKQFDAFVWKPMGLDRHPELRDMLFGNYTKLIYLAQTDSPDLRKSAQDAADRLGLDYEYRFTGYGDLAKALKSAVIS